VWWIGSGATTHISVSIQACMSCQKLSDSERYICASDGRTVEIEATKKFILLLKTEFYLDLNETFIVAQT